MYNDKTLEKLKYIVEILGAIIALLSSAFLILVFIATSSATSTDNKTPEEAFYLSQINDILYTPFTSTWEFDESQDLQTPELPTGCEATAASTLLRMHGIVATKFDVADAMPKSSTGEFVDAFWGDPYTPYGWACMAPCIGTTLKQFLDESQYEVVVSNGKSITNLTYPCQIWVTMYMEDVQWTSYQEDGYKLPYNPHCIIIISIDGQDNSVHCVDPLVGELDYSLDLVESLYDQLGQQAVWINKL